MTEKEIKALMGKYLEGTITKREEAVLESFDAGLLSKNHPKRFPRPPAPKRLRRSKGTRISRASWKGVAQAAGIALLLGLGHSLLAPTGNPQGPVPPLQRTGNTQWGQKLNLTLADGTKVRLNSGSSLKYPEHFQGGQREVELSGEAFFEVATDTTRPFVIKSGELETTVLGTSFNINTYPGNDHIAVTVATGLVRVAAQDREVELGPNQQGLFDRRTGAISKKTTDIGQFLDWKEGVIRFEDAELAQVVDILERWYGADIEFAQGDIGNCHITATYDNVDLEGVLESMVYAKKGLRYEFLDGTRVLIRGSCWE